MKQILVILSLTAIVFSPFCLFAETQKDADTPSETVEIEDVDIYAIPPILDPKYRHRNRNQIEFSPYGGAYLGNSIGQTWLAGARAYYHFNNVVAVGGAWGISKLLTNRSSAFGSSITDSIMQIADAEVMFSNDAALRIGKTAVELDFFGTLGVGGMHLNGKWQPMGVIGGGVKAYFGIPWLAFRIDVNSYAHNVSQPGKDIVDFDAAFLGGISFLFPTNPSPYERTKSGKVLPAK